MKSADIVKKLEQNGHEINYGKYEYWDNIPYYEHDDGSKTYLAETYTVFQSAGVNQDLSYNKVIGAIKHKCYDVTDYKSRLREKQIEREAEEITNNFKGESAGGKF